MFGTGWIPVLIDQDVDADNSEECNLERDYEFLTVIQPELDGAHTVTVHVAMGAGGDYYPIYHLDADETGDLAQISASLATARLLTFRIGGAQFIKIVVGTSVSSDKTFYVKGFNRKN